MKLLYLILLLFPALCFGQPKWAYEESTDKMTSKTRYDATLASVEKLTLASPYDGGTTATLQLSNQNGSNNVFLLVDKGQYNTDINGMNITVKFDDKKPAMFRCGNLAAGRTDAVYIDADKKFITQLKTAKKVLIQVDFYGDGLQVIEFDPEGVVWNH